MWADILASISGILLILVVLIQQSEDDIQDAFSGAKSELFKNRKEQTLDIVLRNAQQFYRFYLLVSLSYHTLFTTKRRLGVFFSIEVSYAKDIS